jgi:integrase
MRLYADYLTREYGSLDSDYVFVNLWSQPYGRPWTYAAVYDLVLRLRERTGIDFEPHQWRHTYATWLLVACLPTFRTPDPIRSGPERRGINARTAQEVHA